MNSIINIGMDVHSTNYTLCGFTMAGQRPFAQTSINPDISELEKYLTTLNSELGGECEFLCGYEAGCLGYSLYHEIQNHKWKGFQVSCVILAPTTMPASQKDRVKTDKRDALKIAKCLTYGTYSAVYVPTDEDNAVKEYIRMRDDALKLLKQTKQQINALGLRHGFHYEGKSKWTKSHLTWLRELELPHPLLRETLEEYLATFTYLTEKIQRFDKRIEELSQTEHYKEAASHLGCLKGIATHTAMALISEIGDFQRFPSAQQFSAFLGLVPGEHSSGTTQHRCAITKAGNAHLRRLLIESASTFVRGKVGQKSVALRKRQQGNPPAVIAYADRANERLKRKYIRLSRRCRPNVAKTAIARELACFVWGMMTGKID